MTLGERLLRMAKWPLVNAAAGLIGEWIIDSGITPDELAAAIAEDVPLLARALQKVSQADLAAARAMYGRFAGGVTPKDYRLILERLEWHFPDHVRVIAGSERGRRWYVRQMEDARAFFASASAGQRTAPP